MKKEELTPESLEKISNALIDGRKIEAIKEYRIATGLGLKEAKEALEEIEHSLAEEHPELLEKKSSGCAALIVFGVITGFTIWQIVQSGIS